MSFEYGRYGNPTTVVLEEKIRLLYYLNIITLAFPGRLCC